MNTLAGYEVIGDIKDGCFEGGGDCVFSSRDVLFAGYGPRTAKEVRKRRSLTVGHRTSQSQVYDKVKSIGNFKVVLCELAHKNFYHLDTCFCYFAVTMHAFLDSSNI